MSEEDQVESTENRQRQIDYDSRSKGICLPKLPKGIVCYRGKKTFYRVKFEDKSLSNCRKVKEGLGTVPRCIFVFKYTDYSKHPLECADQKGICVSIDCVTISNSEDHSSKINLALSSVLSLH